MALTFRALALGFMGAVFVTAYAYANDFGMGYMGTKLIATHLPAWAYVLFFLLIALVNPVLTRLGGRRGFAVAVSMAVLLFAAGCSYLCRSIRGS